MSNFDRDPEYGHDRALAVLDDFASDAPDDQKGTVLNAALHVARACHDGDLTPPERDAALEVAKILKLDPRPRPPDSRPLMGKGRMRLPHPALSMPPSPATGPSVARRHHQTILALGFKTGTCLLGRCLGQAREARLERAVLTLDHCAPRPFQLDRDHLAGCVQPDLTGLLALVAADLDRTGTRLGGDGFLLVLRDRLCPLTDLLLGCGRGCRLERRPHGGNGGRDFDGGDVGPERSHAEAVVKQGRDPVVALLRCPSTQHHGDQAPAVPHRSPGQIEAGGIDEAGLDAVHAVVPAHQAVVGLNRSAVIGEAGAAEIREVAGMALDQRL